MWWATSLVGLIWIIGWIAALHDTQITGGWFKRWIVGPIALFFLWPFVAYEMLKQMG